MLALTALALFWSSSLPADHILQPHERSLSRPEAQDDDPPVSTFASPSGEWSLTVSRSEKDGNGKNELVLTHAGVEAWRVQHEFGLRAAFVGDDGRIAGYGYTGEEVLDFSERRLGRVLRIFVLDPEGHVLLDEEHPRHDSLYPDGESQPVIDGGFIQNELGRFVVRVPDEDVNRHQEEWWGYDLATGKALFRERPKEKLGLGSAIWMAIDARAVPGTPLVLVHWWRSDSGPRKMAVGGVFQLIDPAWKAVWTNERPHDYDNLVWDDRVNMMRQGAILGTARARFELRFVSEKQHVTFAVEPDGESWKVTEVAPLRSWRRPDRGSPRRALTELAGRLGSTA